MNVLVINCGSSSLKYQLINMEDESVLAKGNFERIGEQESFLTHKVNGNAYVIKEPVMNHTEALRQTLPGNRRRKLRSSSLQTPDCRP